MANSTDICNMGLLHLGHGRQISSLTESSIEASYCNTVYDRCRRRVLRAHPWNFALRTVQLAEVSGVDSDEFDYIYQLPTNCLRVLNIVNTVSDAKIKFEIRGRYLYTDEGEAVIRYIFDETDPNKFDDEFQDALSWAIAADIALPITGDATVQKNAVQMYMLQVGGAQASNASEGQPKQNDDYITARS